MPIEVFDRAEAKHTKVPPQVCRRAQPHSSGAPAFVAKLSRSGLDLLETETLQEGRADVEAFAQPPILSCQSHAQSV